MLLLFGLSSHCRHSSYPSLVHLKPNYSNAFLHHYKGNVTGDRVDQDRRVRTLDSIVEVETISALEEEKIVKELNQGQSSLRKWMIFSGVATVASLGVIVMGPAAYAPYAYAGLGTSLVVGAGSLYRESECTNEINKWNSYFGKHQEIRRQIPSSTLQNIKSSNWIHSYLSPEEGEHLWISRIKETEHQLKVHQSDFIGKKIHILKEMIESGLLDRDTVIHFNYTKLPKPYLTSFIEHEILRYEQLINEYGRFRDSYESEKEVRHKLLFLERQQNANEHNVTKWLARGNRDLLHVTEEETTVWSTLLRDNMTDFTTDVVESSKATRDIELIKEYMRHAQEQENQYHEKLAQMFPRFVSVFEEAIEILK